MRTNVAAMAIGLGQLVSATLSSQSYVIPSGQINGTTGTDTIVGLTAFDGPHISVNNGSAYQWWYFDVVSHDSKAAVVAQFYPGWTADASAVLLNIVWPNGTTFAETISVGTLDLTTVDDGSQGYVEDGAMTWFGASDLSAYHLSLNLPDVGVSGKITMRSRAPSHVACGLNRAGASFDFAEFLQWGNSVPDSYATVDLDVNGTSLTFSGSGYHDQNWGQAAFMDGLTQWFWGHSNIGEYSLVFFYHIDEQLKVKSSGYLAKNGNLIVSGCSNIKVIPQGPRTSVPLNASIPVESWAIYIDSSKHGKYAFTIDNKIEASSSSPVYTRWVGQTTGGRVGAANSTGAAIVEFMNNPLKGYY
ncbi:Tyrosinase family protein asqI [Penicillium cataractarum]|uniref:Tyrosinase family protein asqI n=1 Tax=Penicillium cataractarum TaxID=2100454 RepID=A0A9W9UX39_9EURO|nr:Tyrosinase family protein asqI [Penicillium cataractarum]KAJ5358465.1 Tyrosinase family protein asqI [Penicillium cataractarum]